MYTQAVLGKWRSFVHDKNHIFAQRKKEIKREREGENGGNKRTKTDTRWNEGPDEELTTIDGYYLISSVTDPSVILREWFNDEPRLELKMYYALGCHSHSTVIAVFLLRCLAKSALSYFRIFSHRNKSGRLRVGIYSNCREIWLSALK